jgi:uncharacterized protein (DUF1697 family)
MEMNAMPLVAGGDHKMPIYIGLLRGINVGGKNKIKMADLRAMLETMGFERVQTYIQSGNVLFESADEEKTLQAQIEQNIVETFGLTVSVILRSAEELKQIVENCPFTTEEVAEAEAMSQVESLYVAMLPEAPPQAGVERTTVYCSDNDKMHIRGRDVYLLFRQSIRHSKLAGNLHRLQVPATVRNWNTMNKLLTLADSMV